MTTTSATTGPDAGAQGTGRVDWIAVARDLGPAFAARAAQHDADDSFVADNYAELKARRVFSAGVPVELGGGGATYTELCATVRELARHCGATALALAMHTHLLAATVWRLRQGQPVEPLLRRIAAEQLVLVSTGAGDWLESNGSAEPVDGGFRVTARKPFGSGSPMGDIAITSAILDDPAAGPTVLHFPIPLKSAGVTMLDTWHTMAMRGSGSNDLLFEGVFVPEGAVSLRRPKGKWHPFFNVVTSVAMPLIMAVYLGVAEAARDLALQQVARKRDDADVWYLVGEMENALVTGQLAVEDMVQICADYEFAPQVPTANAIVIRKSIAAGALKLAVEKAVEAVGGGALFRSMGLERLLRDIHGAQFHPLQEKRQHRFTGRITLGLDPVA